MNRLEDTDTIKNAFEISGNLIDRIVAVCQGPNEANKWVELLSPDPISSFKPKLNDSIKGMSNSTVNMPTTPSHVSHLIEKFEIKINFPDHNVFVSIIFICEIKKKKNKNIPCNEMKMMC